MLNQITLVNVSDELNITLKEVVFRLEEFSL